MSDNTTLTHPVPGSMPPRRDAPAPHHDGAVTPDDIAVGVLVGRTCEYFDFFVYGLASVLVFPALFFPHLERLDALLASFTVFSLAFVARPVGTLAGMAIQRRYGRGVRDVTLEHDLCTECVVPGSYEINLVAHVELVTGQKKRFIVGRFKRYDPTRLGESLRARGWSVESVRLYGGPTGKGAALMLLRRAG